MVVVGRRLGEDGQSRQEVGIISMEAVMVFVGC